MVPDAFHLAFLFHYSYITVQTQTSSTDAAFTALTSSTLQHTGRTCFFKLALVLNLNISIEMRTRAHPLLPLPLNDTVSL